MRTYTLLAVAVVGIVLAIVVNGFLRQSAAEPPPIPAQNSVTGLPAAFYLDATSEQARTVAERSFYRMASDRPERLGTLKDDLALLLDRDELVEFILGEWHVRRNEGRYADAAFADIFTLVRNAKFVEPTKELLLTPEPLVSMKAVEAAITQADPALSPALVPVLRRLQQSQVSDAATRRANVVRAAVACGGDGLAACLQVALQDADPWVVITAAVAIADGRLTMFDADLRAVLRTNQDPRVRANVAAALVVRGDLGARRVIIESLDPKAPAGAAEASHLVAKHRITEALDELSAQVGKTEGELRRMFELAMLRLGDRSTRERLRRVADTAGDPGEIDALQLVAASGDADAVPVALRGVERGGAARWRAIAAGIATSREPAFIPVLKLLLEKPIAYAAELSDAVSVGGDEVVPILAAKLHAATDPVAQINLIAWIGIIGTSHARAALVAERTRIPRLVDERLRLMDLDARRAGRSFQ